MRDRRTDAERRRDLETGADLPSSATNPLAAPALTPGQQVQQKVNHFMNKPEPAKKKRPPRKASAEIRAMNTIEALLEPLTVEAKCRVLTWLSAKIQEENRQKYAEARAEDMATQQQFGARLEGPA